MTDESLDAPMWEIQETLAEWYRVGQARRRPELPEVIDYDVRTLFPGREGRPAADFLRSERHRMIRRVYYWTGL